MNLFIYFVINTTYQPFIQERDWTKIKILKIRNKLKNNVPYNLVLICIGCL